jgi:hypothetical protein
LQAPYFKIKEFGLLKFIIGLPYEAKKISLTNVPGGTCPEPVPEFNENRVESVDEEIDNLLYEIPAVLSALPLIGEYCISPIK